ncbi:MAG: MBL fold metallo-hydrolase [Lachnospiraceae bacterium]|nr:MBL fold metallo-hydrolase [Lachnospiraceae bacterium]
MAEVHIGRTVLGMGGTNCYFIYKDDGKTVVFDPGFEGKKLYDRLTEKGLSVSAIVLTHGHYDHILGVKELKEAAGCKVYAPEAEKQLLLDVYKNCSADIGRPCAIEADVFLKDGQEVEIDGIKFTVLLTPGHTAGSACYYFETEKFLIAGDTLFYGSVGRTDLPTGNMGDLAQSLKKKLMVLPEDVVVYPGHGDETTIGDEKQYNPFC